MHRAGATQQDHRSYSNPVVFLRGVYSERREANPRYSLRAFARHLGISSGLLSEILTEKRSLTTRMAERFAQSLGLYPEQTRQFVGAVAARSAHRRANLAETLVQGLDERYKLLQEDHFCAIADWYHFAVLNLLDTVDCQSDPKWFARRLGISVMEARQAIDRLIRLGLVRDDGVRLTATQADLTTTHDVPSAALRKSHRQSLEKAAAALDEIPMELRDITSISMAADPTKIPEAKRLIKRLRRDLCALLESGNRTEVFTLNVQLHPLTRVQERENR